MSRDDRERSASEGSEKPVYSGERLRQGRVVLNTPLRRRIFFAGLIGFVILAFVLTVLF